MCCPNISNNNNIRVAKQVTSDKPQIIVKDTRLALAQLAGAVRAAPISITANSSSACNRNKVKGTPVALLKLPWVNKTLQIMQVKLLI
jgi:hypothetical protein